MTGSWGLVNKEMFMEVEFNYFFGLFKRAKWISENDTYFVDVVRFVKEK